MDVGNVLMWMILFCVCVIVLMVFSKPLKWVVKVALSAILGAGGIFLLNFLLSPFQIAVGINALTLLVTGILGIPGILSLYAIQIIL